MSSDDERDDLREDEEDDEYRPSDNPLDPSSHLPSLSTVVPPPQKRGRKPHPNPAVRSAREAARRANHSVIEKRRREKINNALSELRTLVPTQLDEGLAGVGSTSNDPTAGNATKVQPKEYKLEVLVRTVAYLKQLVDRVESLERVTPNRVQGSTEAREQNIPLDCKPSVGPIMPGPGLCTNCAAPLRLSDPHIPSSSEANSTYQQRLPSLASLLNPGPPPNQQLLSPPASGSLCPTHRGSTSPYFPSRPPSLHLPSSSLSLPQQMATRLDTSPLPPPGSRLLSMTPSPVLYPTTEVRSISTPSSYTKPSPVFPPVPPQQRRERSHDDDLAISMLLNMSRSSSQGNSSASSTYQPSPVECHKQYSITGAEANRGGNGTPNTVTPSSVLGIHQSEQVGKGKRRSEWQEVTNRAKRTKVE